MSNARAQDQLTPTSEIPDKLYFRIGEVARLVGVEAHVLRYWEKEVPSVRPIKSASNQRRYRRKDVEIFRQVKRLLYEERYTLAGAKKRLISGPQTGEQDEAAAAPVAENTDEQLPASDAEAPVSKNLDSIRAGLKDIIRLVGEDV